MLSSIRSMQQSAWHRLDVWSGGHSFNGHMLSAVTGSLPVYLGNSRCPRHTWAMAPKEHAPPHVCGCRSGQPCQSLVIRCSNNLPTEKAGRLPPPSQTPTQTHLAARALLPLGGT